MKNASLLLFLALSARLFGQIAYTPFEFDGSIWREYYYDGTGGGVFSKDYQYTVDGDTTINGIQYFKLNVLGFGLYYTGPMSPKYYFSNYVGAIRETAGKEIRIVLSGKTEETFLYRFDINPGDTIQIYNQLDNIVTVEHIDTVEICGKERNRYLLHFSNGVLNPVYLIEGVGTTHGLIPEYEFFESGTRLDCYSNTHCEPCETIAGQNEPAVPKNPVRVFPNPATDLLTIESPGINWLAMDIYDSRGVLKETARETTGTKTLDISNWESGVYFVRIRFENAIQAEKIIRK